MTHFVVVTGAPILDLQIGDRFKRREGVRQVVHANGHAAQACPQTQNPNHLALEPRRLQAMLDKLLDSVAAPLLDLLSVGRAFGGDALVGFRKPHGEIK